MKKRASITLSLSVLMTALLIHPSCILAHASETPEDRIHEGAGSILEDPPSEKDDNELLDSETVSNPIIDSNASSEIEVNENDSSADRESRPLPDDSVIDPEFTFDPDALPSEPELPTAEEEIPPATGSDVIDSNAGSPVAINDLEDPLEPTEIEPMETQADETYLGSIPLSFSNDTDDQILTVYGLNIKVDSDMSLVNYDSDFNGMGINNRNIAFLITDNTGSVFDLVDIPETGLEWILLPQEKLEIEIHIKVSCSSRMYKMSNEVLYEYRYEVEPAHDSILEVPKAPETPEIPSMEQGVMEPESQKPSIGSIPESDDLPASMPAIPDETFDEGMMVDPQPNLENETELLPVIKEEVYESVEDSEKGDEQGTITEEIMEEDVVTATESPPQDTECQQHKFHE